MMYYDDWMQQIDRLFGRNYEVWVVHWDLVLRFWGLFKSLIQSICFWVIVVNMSISYVSVPIQTHKYGKSVALIYCLILHIIHWLNRIYVNMLWNIQMILNYLFLVFLPWKFGNQLFSFSWNRCPFQCYPSLDQLG